jgi:hypothetical protein
LSWNSIYGLAVLADFACKNAWVKVQEAELQQQKI